MEEDAPSLRLLLMLSYPRTFLSDPQLDNVLDLKRAAAVARKFDANDMVRRVEDALCKYAEEEPAAAYAIAWRYEFKNALRAAARASLGHLPFFNGTWDTSK